MNIRKRISMAWNGLNGFLKDGVGLIEITRDKDGKFGVCQHFFTHDAEELHKILEFYNIMSWKGMADLYLHMAANDELTDDCKASLNNVIEFHKKNAKDCSFYKDYLKTKKKK